MNHLIEDFTSEQLNLNKDLIKAIQENNIEKVIQLLNKGADPNFNYDEALIKGAMFGSLESIKILIKNTEYEQNNMEAAFYQSACHDHTSIMRYLLTQGVDINFIPEENESTLSMVAECGALNAVKLLVNKSINPDLESAMIAAISHNQLNVIKYLHKKSPDLIYQIPMIYSTAGVRGYWETIDFLLSKKVEFSKNNIDFFAQNSFIEPLQYVVNAMSDKPENVYHILGYAMLGSEKTREWVEKYKLGIKLKKSLENINKFQNQPKI